MFYFGFADLEQTGSNPSRISPDRVGMREVDLHYLRLEATSFFHSISVLILFISNVRDYIYRDDAIGVSVAILGYTVLTLSIYIFLSACIHNACIPAHRYLQARIHPMVVLCSLPFCLDEASHTPQGLRLFVPQGSSKNFLEAASRPQAELFPRRQWLNSHFHMSQSRCVHLGEYSVPR